ncbi:MAG: aminotransferase class V-fold PLP-dependent enzyme [Patescibacteria group bacterium]
MCLRAGHHCAQPLHRRLGISASTRVSVALYNTLTEMEIFLQELHAAVTRLS